MDLSTTFLRALRYLQLAGRFNPRARRVEARFWQLRRRFYADLWRAAAEAVGAGVAALSGAAEGDFLSQAPLAHANQPTQTSTDARRHVVRLRDVMN